MALGNRIDLLGAGLSWHKAPELCCLCWSCDSTCQLCFSIPQVLLPRSSVTNIDLISRRIGSSVIFTQSSNFCRGESGRDLSSMFQSPYFLYEGEDDLGEIREDLEAHGKVWGGGAGRCSCPWCWHRAGYWQGWTMQLLSKYLDFLLFASKQSKACFSTELEEQFSTTQICTGGDAQLQRAGYKTLSLIFFFIGTDFPNTLQLHLYSHLPDWDDS